MIQIKQNIIDLIKDSQDTRNRLAYSLGKSSKTIDRYLDDNDIMLTTAIAVTAISEELKITESEILTEA